MNILLSGITGFVGQHLALELKNKGHTVFAVIRQSSKVEFLEKNNIKFHRFDGKISELIMFLKENQITGCIHLASLYLTTHTQNDITELINSNVLFSTQLLESCSQAKIKWFINTGTFWQHFNDEEYNPVNLYAATKQAFLSVAEYYIQTSQVNFSTLQLSDTYGPDDTRPKLISLWKKIATTGEEFEMSAGEQIIDMCYIDDIVRAFVLLAQLLEKDEKQIHNGSIYGVSNSERITLKELAIIFEEATQRKLNIKWGKKPYRTREVMKPWTKSLPVPGWKPTVTLKEGIKLTVNAQGY